jgi:hypothetical protein
MKINFQPWHKEVISLWEKLLNENKVVQATLYAYKSNSSLIIFGVNLDQKGKVELSRFDEQFFGMFASENSNERSSESVTRILEDQIKIPAEKILLDIENDADVEIVSHVFQLVYYPLTKGAYIVPNDRKFVNLKKYNENIISEIKNIISVFEKNLIAA